jgi:RND family efflux transporter MFP subunit
VPGYLKSWKHDIGARVKAGDLLAEIETPDLDQELLQAKADLASAQASASLAETTAARWNAMLGSDSVSKQEVDEKTGDYATKKALVNAAQANVNRLVATKAFTRIVAPFDGVVTARSTDVGALINAGSGGGPELFVVSDTAKLRVYVSVPQQYVPSVPPGTRATMTVPEHPDQTYAATVESSAQAVNAASGTTLMQLLVDNAHGDLMPGGYASLKLNLAGRGDGLTIPASALIFGAGGLTVATVDANGRVDIKPVTVQRDLGQRIEIASGLAVSDRVIDNPPDDIENGNRVNVFDAPGSSPSGREVAGGADLHHDAS